MKFCLNDNGTVVFLYADDTKIYKYISCEQDKKELQHTINMIVTWIDKYLLKLNVDKCKHVSYVRGASVHASKYVINEDTLETLDSYKDLGVLFDSKLNFGLHIMDKVKKANSMLGIIKRNFSNMSYHSFLCLYKAMVRSHLEYAVPVWCPYKKEYIELVERVQMRATKILPNLKSLPYKDRLKYLNLPTLKYRRMRGDVIEMFKMVRGIYDRDVILNLNFAPYSNTRGNSFKLFQQHCKYDLRKHFFVNRVTCVWNGLPDFVINAPSINSFKNRLDHFWEDQELLHDWHADISGTGNRSFD